MKKVLCILMSILLMSTVFVGCGEKSAENGRVYYLNFKPEQDAAWQSLAKVYEEKTGQKVSVVTAAQGKYEETLTAAIDKSDAPTIFQISGTTALDAWRDYCEDLKDTDVYKQLTSDDFAVMEDGKVYGVAYVYEGFGLIANKNLLKKAGYELSDIKDFKSLK
ncbi:MAG: ABC transporter substrate-binding protein, partial [Clostridia bacterium]|nr:ABC transporter substrate-binding protein [Clostridia bacterium]